MTGPAIAMDNASVVYRGGHKALRDASVAIAPGECVLVTGASGSGKSTLASLVNGLVPNLHEAEVTGSVCVLGQDPTNSPLHQTGRAVATVFQNPRSQFFCSDLFAEMAFGSENAGEEPGRIRDRAARIAERMGVAELAGRNLFTLSGGERQRVALASAVCDQTDVLVLDEPTANLDEAGVADLRAALRLLREDGVTVLMVEHRLHHLRGLVDQVLRVQDGRIARSYRPQEFWGLSDQERRALDLRCLEPPEEGPPARPPAPGPGLVCARPGSEELCFPAGKVTALVGRNGAGKTTLARTLAGLGRSPAAVSLFGEQLSRRARSQRVFLVMQDVERQLFAPSVRDELLLARPRASTAAAQEALEALGIGGLADRHPLSLSGGQKQRVAVASALVDDREAHIFDEPSSGLDHRGMLAVACALGELAARGKAVVLITHDHELVRECAHGILLLDKKR